jgi:hypothetical protein
MTDDLDFYVPAGDPTRPERKPAKCRRHRWVTFHDYFGDGPMDGTRCDRCGKAKDQAGSRRGKNNRARGNAIEREIGKRLGLRRVGQYGGPEDLSGDLFAVQVKSGGAFSERYWAWLKAVPVNAGQTPPPVVTDAPGPGHARRAVVVLDITEWVALHGPTGGIE